MSTSFSRFKGTETEFVAMIAFMFAIVALSVDAMLPAMPQIVDDLQLHNPQHAPLILTAFLLGLGVATLFAGPLSDALGRRRIVFGGFAVYSMGSLLAWQAPTFEWMIAARILQGIGAAGPRVVSQAIVRDAYSGEDMARILSYTMIIFLTVPALAPMMGAVVVSIADWRMIFGLFLAFAFVMMIWFGLRQPETLPADKRKGTGPRRLAHMIRESLSPPVVQLSIVVQTLSMALLFTVLSMVQPIFDVTFDRNASFPYWFGGLAVIAAASGILNARIVARFGMRRAARRILQTQIPASAVALCLFLVETPFGFYIYLVWQVGVLMQVGMTSANLNAMAMEPNPHVAGTTASIMGGISMIGGAGFASLLAQLFDGTPVPLFIIAIVISALSVVVLIILQHREAASPGTRTPQA